MAILGESNTSRNQSELNRFQVGVLTVEYSVPLSLSALCEFLDFRFHFAFLL